MTTIDKHGHSEWPVIQMYNWWTFIFERLYLYKLFYMNMLLIKFVIFEKKISGGSTC